MALKSMILYKRGCYAFPRELRDFRCFESGQLGDFATYTKNLGTFG